ncbi:MAG TPA: divergent PAP2 family protein [Anaerolineales bacterium]|nr:divergent PAP2 family protein [Anaerolineales bacterium]
MQALLSNTVLIAALIAWSIAQVVKIPLHFLLKREWDWSLLMSAGGMPSSHSALVVAVTHAIGLTLGFGSPLYALAVVLAMIVLYDATGVRRQAGEHARVINAIVSDLVAGHPLKEEQLKELIGHTPGEVIAGATLGLVVAQITAMVAR